MYEKGVAVFKYPHVRDIWLAYLQHFVKRYGGTKLERARDLFKQALREVPPGHDLLSKAWREQGLAQILKALPVFLKSVPYSMQKISILGP